MIVERIVASCLILLLAACARGPVPPAALDTANDACAYCRMAVSSVRFAGQIVAPGEEPTFFDDLGCLGNHVKERRSGMNVVGTTTYVADHCTGEWVAAARAVYTRVDAVQTPMGSHLLAHADVSSRDADPDARGGVAVSMAELFGPSGPPQ